MKNELLTPVQWILETHLDPDNIHECNSNGCVDIREETYPIKEDVCYSLMKQYSEYCRKKETEEIREEIEKEKLFLEDQLISNLISETLRNYATRQIKHLQTLLNKLQ